MNRKESKNRVELLAPAGSYESLTAAIAAGADAVYIGGSMFGARAYANNFDTEELKKAIDYVHLHGKNMYLTVNTLVKEDEIENELYNYIEPLYNHGLDAVIVQDMGVLKFIKNYFPDLPIHASTQMTLTGHYGAGLMEELGVTRIVTARELSFSEISKIHKKTNLEIESFIHGALCFSYSGQCLFSSLAGGRSGNRGRCAQPCRLPYEALEGDKKIGNKNEQYLLSPKDLCTIESLPEIIESGVYSLKIEGRMKKPEYTAGVVSIYRKYLDLYLENGRENYKVDKKDIQKLSDIFNRGGFTEGYFGQHNGRDMLFLEGKENKKQIRNEVLFEEIQAKYLNKELKEIIKGKVRIYKEMPAIISLSFQNIQIEVSGEVVQAAKNQPMTEEKIRKQVEKTGNTGFVFGDLEIDTDNSSFIPINSLNELRRLGLEELEKTFLDKYHRNNATEKLNMAKEKDKKLYKSSYQINCYIEKLEYLNPLLKIDEIDGIYIDYSCIKPLALKNIVSDCKKKG
ncbi:MAG: U32 family peptidase, partial [Clostridiales bacterium]|nr:U32 family peptidase [Clostridiales bacterium]